MIGDAIAARPFHGNFNQVWIGHTGDRIHTLLNGAAGIGVAQGDMLACPQGAQKIKVATLHSQGKHFDVPGLGANGLAARLNHGCHCSASCCSASGWALPDLLFKPMRSIRLSTEPVYTPISLESPVSCKMSRALGKFTMEKTFSQAPISLLANISTVRKITARMCSRSFWLRP